MLYEHTKMRSKYYEILSEGWKEIKKRLEKKRDPKVKLKLVRSSPHFIVMLK